MCIARAGLAWPVSELLSLDAISLDLKTLLCAVPAGITITPSHQPSPCLCLKQPSLFGSNLLEPSDLEQEP